MPFCEICVQSGGSVLGMLYQENSESPSLRAPSLAVGILEG